MHRDPEPTEPAKAADDPLRKADNGYTLGPVQAVPACCDPQPLIQVENFSLRYGLKTALANVTLDIYRGCITALIGPSGCGKTSFLSSINRLTDLIPGSGITGRICIDGGDIHDPARDVQALRRQIGMVFQKPTPFPLSIYRNIELPLHEHGVKRRVDTAAVIEQVLRDHPQKAGQYNVRGCGVP